MFWQKIVNFVFSFQDSTLGSHRSFHLDPDDSGLQRNRAYASDHRRFGEIPWPEEDGKPRETARKRRGTQEACSTQTFPQRAKGEGRGTWEGSRKGTASKKSRTGKGTQREIGYSEKIERTRGCSCSFSCCVLQLLVLQLWRWLLLPQMGRDLGSMFERTLSLFLQISDWKFHLLWQGGGLRGLSSRWTKNSNHLFLIICWVLSCCQHFIKNQWKL